MRKVIKILVKLLSAAVLLLIILPVALSLLLDVPAVQNYIVHKAADYASRRLETRVGIDRVNIGLFNKIQVHGFYVEDYRQDTLLYVGELRALFTGMGLAGEGLSFGYGHARDVKLYICETPDSVMNIKQIVDRLSRRDGKGNFRMTISKVDVDNLTLHIERLEHRNPVYGVDYGNMRLRNLCGLVDNLTIVGSAVSGRIEDMSFDELSGFEAESVSGEFMVDKGVIALDDMRIRAGASDVRLRKLTIAGDGWSAYKDFIHNVKITASAYDTSLTSDEAGYFAPRLREWKMRLGGLNMTFDGTVDNFAGTISDVHVDGRTRLRADVAAEGLPDVRNTDFRIDLRSLATDGDEVRSLASRVARIELPARVSDILDRCGSLTLNGRFAGELSSFRTRGRLGTSVGELGFNAVMRPAPDDRSAIGATFSSGGMNLGRLLGEKRLGRTDFVATADGTFGSGGYAVNVDANISRFTFGSYVCRNISVDGRAEDGDVRGRMRVDDGSLKLDLQAALDLGREEPSYDMVMDLHRADLAALGINRRDSVSLLSASIGLNAAGRIPDDVNGELSVADAKYVYDSGEITSEYMNISVSSNEDLRSVKLASDFADAVFESRNDYRDVWTYLNSIICRYLPLLYAEQPLPAAPARRGHRDTQRHSLSLLSLTTRNFNPVADAVVRGLQVADGSQVQMLLDPVYDRFVMRAKTDYIERNRLLATSLRLDMSNDADTLAMRLEAGDLYLGTLHLPDLTFRGSARDNRLRLSGDFRDTLREFSGRIGLAAQLRRDAVTNLRGVDVSFLPSYIERKNDRWNISAHNISADSARIAVDDFAIRNSRQELTVNGVASRSRTDSLTMRLNNFDIAPFTQVASRMGYVIEGRTDGFATVKSALHGSEITANIRLDSLEVNSLPVKSLLFGSKWDFELNRARVAISTVAERDTIIRGYYVPSQVRYFARLNADSLDMALIDPMLQGVVSGTRGVASADLTLMGERREADLRGDITVRDLSTRVDFTQVTYSVPDTVHIAVKNNRFKVGSARVFDPEGHSGDMSFDLSLNHLSNIAYTLNVRPENMLVLNTTVNDNDYFYGKVYASGAATIAGDKSGVNMDIVASTDENTEFFLPLSNSSDVSAADFVTFEQADKPDTTDYLVRKKLMFERRQRQRTSSAGRLDVNMALDVRPNAMFQLVIDPTVGDIIKGRGEGALNLHINPKANIFEMYGDYTITEGSYLFTLQNIINKKFIIEEGSTIHWTGEPVDALLNIDAVYKVKASLQPLLAGSVSSSNVPLRAVPVDCIIHLSDRLTNPSVTFDVVVPNADPDVQSLVANALSTPESRSQQFLYLLVANSFISEAASDTAGSLGATASAATGFELLSNQLSNWLSADTYNIVIRYRPKTELTSDEVDIGFSTGLIDNRLLLEVEGNYLVDRTMAANPNSNIMGEAYLTWLIDRAGNLRLRGFTHTIDRFDENQGLQETGIGIYYKESFNNLKDLKQRVRERVAEGRCRRADNREERRRRREERARAAATDPVKDEDVPEGE